MPFDIEFYHADTRTEWERFIKRSNQGTIFQHQYFLDYHPEDRFNHRHLIFRKKGHIQAVWPGAFRDEDGKKSWTSHPGASYGGLVTLPYLSIKDAHDMIYQLIQEAKNQRVERLRCTLVPLIYHKYPSDVVEFSLLRAGFKYLKQDYTQVVDLTRMPVGEENIIATYDSKTRTSIRRARKLGVAIRHGLPIKGQALKDFYWILDTNRERLGVTPTHTEEELEKLGYLAPNQLDLSMAYIEDTPIAGMLNFICNDKVLLEFYIAHRHDYQHFRPVPLLVHESVLIAKGRGFKWLDFGISTEPGNKITWGLAAFKENFRVQGFFRNTLYLDDIKTWEPPENFMMDN